MISLDSSIYPKNNFDDNTVLTLTHSHQTWYVQYGKRLFDLVVSTIVCVLVLSWLVPILWLSIRINSPGPGLFIQPRTGRNGRPFRCLKFRTMYHEPNPVFAQATLGDPRVTRLGNFLRRTNLDEMPQFWNVLLGDMSVVGPRPHAVQHDSQYWSEIANYQFRYVVRPGITGLAQVRGARGETDELIKMRHRLRYDLHYMRRQSLLVDINLCWLTLKPMLKGSVNAW